MQRTICIELNEINFDSIKHYAATGLLPTFKMLMDHHGLIETTSENEYEHLEPWIQWVTAHTGKTFAEHQVFRLGDIVKTEIDQIWELIEQKGYTVGAISPMNAKNRTSRAAFFVPDPWTSTQVTGDNLLRGMYNSIRQTVNDNAQARVSLKSLGWLLMGAAMNARSVNYMKYLSLALGARTCSWNKALFLDLLLSDMFITLLSRKHADFVTIFLNAAAHIQHHYMFSAESYQGSNKNPEWYAPAGLDPVKDVYVIHDEILRQIMSAFPDARFIVMTGLHQDAHHKIEYYWRLRDHAAFLREHGIGCKSVEPRMSRDFLISCNDENEARAASRILTLMRSSDGQELFYVDKKGTEVFVMLVYPDNIGENFEYTVGNTKFNNLRKDVAFVAIKNGKHNGVGYLIDTLETGESATDQPRRVPLASVFDRLLASAA